jgi:hypothetical protein
MPFASLGYRREEVIPPPPVEARFALTRPLPCSNSGQMGSKGCESMRAYLFACCGLLSLSLPCHAASRGVPPAPAVPLRFALQPPPPDNLVVEGRVTAVDRKALTFRVRGQRVEVTPDTRIYIRKGFGSFKDITVGRRVRVAADGRRAKEVTLLDRGERGE